MMKKDLFLFVMLFFAAVVFLIAGTTSLSAQQMPQLKKPQTNWTFELTKTNRGMLHDGDTASFLITITMNFGQLENVQLSAGVDNDNIVNFTIPLIKMGEKKNYKFNWTAKIGSHKAWAALRPGGRITISNPKTYQELTFTVLSKDVQSGIILSNTSITANAFSSKDIKYEQPDLAFKSIKPEFDSPACSVPASFIGWGLRQGCNLKIKVVIVNNGGGTWKPTKLKIECESQSAQFYDIPVITKGETRTYQYTFSAGNKEPGYYDCNLLLDEQKLIKESDENNNYKSKIIAIFKN